MSNDKQGFSARELEGRWYLVHNASNVWASALTADEATVRRWARVLNASDTAEEAEKTRVERWRATTVVSISALPEDLTIEAAREFAAKLWGNMAVVGLDPSRDQNACSVGWFGEGGLNWMGHGPTFKAAFLDAEQYL